MSSENGIHDELLQELNRYKQILQGKRVLVELPEGLKRLEKIIEDFLESIGAEAYFRLEPSYGACETLACEANRLGFQAVLHVGHYPYPLEPITSCNGVRVVYLPLRFPVTEDEVHRAVEKIKSSVDRRDKLVLAYTPQFELLARAILKSIQELGYSVVRSAPVLGCYFYGLEESDGEVYIVVGGRFHALGLGLALHGEKRVILVGEEVVDYTDEIRRVLRVRYGKVLEARSATTWGVIVGARPGQYRPGLARRVESILRERGYKVRLYVSVRTLIQDLDAIRDVDAFVITSCPRIAIEDAASYTRPVLTPGEVYYLLGLTPRIVFPW